MPVRKYHDETATILWGDVHAALRTLAPASVDLIVADPPYNLGKRFGASHDRWPDEPSYLAWCAGWRVSPQRRGPTAAGSHSGGSQVAVLGCELKC